MPNEEELSQLQEQAKKILASIPLRSFNPVVIEFSGSPKAGKSTCIDIVSHFFKRTGFKVWAPTEGASKRTPYHLRHDLVAYNTWTLNYAISELFVSYYNVDRQHLIILDRGPFDSLAWMSLIKKQNKLNDAECKIIKDFALHPRWSYLISRVYLFTCDPEISLEREGESKLTILPGSAMNPEMLSNLLKEYKILQDELREYPLHPIETSRNTTPLSTSFEIAKDILDLFDKGLNGV